MSISSRLKVAVLRGGPSYAYEDSLKTGAYVLNHLRTKPEEYEPLDVFISRDSEWHLGGVVNEPHRILSQVNVAWNALHGPYGEDGQVQKLLDGARVPYVGSGSLGSTFSFDKTLSKDIYRKSDLLTPASITININTLSENLLIEIFQTFMHPVVVKPADGSHGLGVRLVNTYQDLRDAVKKSFLHTQKVMVEEYVRGSVASCVVLEEGRGERYYTFVPTRLDTMAKVSSHSVADNRYIAEMAQLAHRALGLRHFSSSDFIISPKGKIYILETNSVPVLHENSLTHKAFEHTGWSGGEFIDHCVRLGLNQ